MMNRHIIVNVSYTNQPSSQFVKTIVESLKINQKNVSLVMEILELWLIPYPKNMVTGLTPLVILVIM